MMESRSFYYGNENHPKTKGWSARLTYKGDYGVNRGCNGFSTRLEAEKWLKEYVQLWKDGKVGFVGYEIEECKVVKIC